MKKISLLILSSLMAFSAASNANKIVITGEPVVLEKQGDAYIVPETYNPSTPYYYVSVDGGKHVCYLEKQPTLSALNGTTLNISYKGSQVVWNCYPVDTNYFEVQ